VRSYSRISGATSDESAIHRPGHSSARIGALSPQPQRFGVFEQCCQHRQGAIEQPLPRARATVTPAVNVGRKDVCHAYCAELRRKNAPPRIPIPLCRRCLPDPREVIPMSFDKIRKLRRGFDDGALRKAVERDFGQ
jgi:hypothetical protein